jgi:hypothetical protein
MERRYRYKKSAATVAGVLSFNTSEIRGNINLFQVKPATSTTRYTVTVTNDESVVVYKVSNSGNLVDERIKSWYGIYTIAISGATADENFDFTLHYTDLQ